MTRLLIAAANLLTLGMAWFGITTSAACYWGRFAPFHWVMFVITLISGVGASYYTLLGSMKENE